MKVANIATAKNQFSRLIERVKHGETILITERDRPVARLQPLDAGEPSLEMIHASGLLNPPEGLLDLAAFLAAPRPLTKTDGSLAGAINEEREQGR
jgi:prevent-host-death family protein